MVRDLFMFAGFNKNSQIAWFKIIYSKEPGSLSLITDFLEKENAFIMFGHLDNITQKAGEYSVFTELNENVDPGNLAQKIKSLEVVSEVEYGISKYGMIYSVDFPLNIIGVRGVAARALTIVDIIKTLNENVAHAEGLLTISGLKGGIHAAKYFKSIMPLNDSNFANVLAELYRAVGWGILEIDCNPETYEGKIVVKDSFIADVYGASEQPVCAFMSGYFAGYLTEYFGKNISVREVSCKATGKKVCEHIISLAPSGSSQEYQTRGDPR
ncbi:MAG TPA: V4R domain-containing protein [Methanosarcina barkeri]|nr:V4R domain-containing protein [Methanosarcina barkeri]